MLGRRIGAGRVAEVYADGDDVLKLYAAGIGPEQAEREAAVLDVLLSTSLVVPKALGVIEIQGRWGLRMTRMAGTPLALAEGSASILADLHYAVHSHSISGLPSLKPRLADRISRAEQLGDEERRALLRRLANLNDGSNLCHGDFHPANIMVGGAGPAIIDWLDASSGSAAADVARTYLLAKHHFAALAEPYLDAYVARSTIERDTVMSWLPVLAAARLTEHVPDEETALLALARTSLRS
nr:aminoglycoside phosphotransferase family protein [uncultured Devosia sp.]